MVQFFCHYNLFSIFHSIRKVFFFLKKIINVNFAKS